MSTTQTEVEPLLSLDDELDSSITRGSLLLSARENSARDVRWRNNLEAITVEVSDLFSDEVQGRRAEQRLNGSSSEFIVSQSLPSTSQMPDYRRTDIEIDLRDITKDDADVRHLQLAPPARADLVSRAPKAITVYINSDDTEENILPSTLGHRTETARRDWRTHSPSTMYNSRTASKSTPTLSSPITPASCPTAYSILTSLVKEQSETSKSMFSFSRRPGSGSSASTATERPSISSPARSRDCESPEGYGSRINTSTPRRKASPGRPMTPPIEELSASSASSESHPIGYRTVQSLRKILSDQPLPKLPVKLRPPEFLLHTPAVQPTSDTSLATAHVSRLFTKNTHRSDAAPRSALKKPELSPLLSQFPPASPALSTSSLGDTFLGRIINLGGSGSNSASNSVRSTPKRISFATLPESYANSRPEGSVKFRTKKDRAQRKAVTRAAVSKIEKAKGRDAEDEESRSWWSGWLMGASAGATATGFGMHPSRHEEFAEERNSRNWGGRGFEEWGA